MGGYVKKSLQLGAIMQ